jgi:GT2 family glycosyltransferase/glycosyltransferase involved in cell wall biosynthesis
MLAKLLHFCGLNLGPEKDLMAAQSDNPDGFWENLRFVQLNDEILNATGGAWDLPPREKETFDAPDLRLFRTKAHLLVESFGSESIWGWKDPRNCLTFPFWKKLLPGLRTVWMVRNPLEVAYSMRQRNGTSYALGLRLWEIYNRRLLLHTQPSERIVTHYQTFFEEPEPELRRIAAFADLPETEIAAAAALVAVSRRHTSFSLEQLIDAGVSEQLVALYRSLLKEAAGSRSARARKTSPSGGHRQDALKGVGNQINLGIAEAETVRRELAWRRGAEIEQRETFGALQGTIEQLRQELAAKSVQAAAEISRRDGRIEELQKAYAHLDHLLLGEQAQRNQLLSELERTRRESDQQSKRAQEQLDRSARELAETRDHLLSELERTRREFDQQSKRAQEQLDRSARELAEMHAQRDQLLSELERTHEQLAGSAKELTNLRNRFLQTNQLLHEQSVRLLQASEQGTSLAGRLRTQLQHTKRLVRLLDEVERAAARLRQSRRWLLANPITGLAAKMAGRPLPGFGHLDKNVAKYLAWRSAYPEMLATLDEAIQDLSPRQLPAAPSDSSPAEPPPASSVIQPPPPAAPIAFPIHEEVRASIVIPVFNQLQFTLSCLGSVQQHAGDIPFEVIVVDDCSTDETADVIGALPGVVYLRNDTNEGFIASCNRGAEAARGEYLLFLNNDTTVTAGWLSNLLETFAFDSTAGLVGSKLIYPDGRLQEAGGIIWRDGSGWNRGKFQEAGKPEYNYLRKVDYCSAASLMIRKALFDDLGGFDSKYAPAYYEDTDLAFKVAQSGHTVLYQPTSVVIHYEGVTGGTDTSKGTKKYQELNRTTFLRTWSEMLATKPVNGDLRSWQILPEGHKRILVIDHHLPLADRDSGSLRMFQILTILGRLGHRVTFIPDNLADIPPYGDNLRKCGIEVMHHPYISSVREYLRSNGTEFDIVILSRCDFARKHIAEVRLCAPQARLIFDTVDLHFLREEREAKLLDSPQLRESAARKQQLEYALIDQADETWVVSPAERDLLRSVRPNSSIEVVSNIVDIPGSAASFSHRRDILFIGSFQHPPNTDAVLFFTQQIFPLVQKLLPDVRFYIIGDKAPPEVIALASEQVIVTGFQPNVSVFFDTIKLSIAPLRFGAGVKGKINQSMAFGVPVVATSLAAEGMGLTDRQDVMAADDPAKFADALVELYTSEELWNRLCRNGLAKTRERYSTEAARSQLRCIFDTQRSDKSNVAAPLSEPAALEPLSHPGTLSQLLR